MTEPIWARILGVLYEQDLEGDNVGLVVADDPKIHFERIGEEIDESPDAVRSTMGYMDSIGLIDGWDKEKATEGEFGLGDTVNLTEKGFDVAHERELTKRQDRTNWVLALLTGALVFAALVQALGSIVSANVLDGWVMVPGTLIIGIAVMGVLWWPGLLTSPR